MRIWPWNLKSNICFISCLKVCEWENIGTWYLDTKEFTNQREHFLDFYRFPWSYVGPKSNLHPQTEISSMGSLTLKLSIESSESWKIISSNFQCFKSCIICYWACVKKEKGDVSFKFSIGPSYLISEMATSHLCWLKRLKIRVIKSRVFL